MVSTRGHPQEFPEPDLTPSKSTPSRTRKAASNSKWSHTPSNLAILWLLISLPLVAWDTVYVLGRPHTMPGGSLHWPLWVPYDLYGKVDYIYGWKAFNDHNGFTAAQGFLNVVESLIYVYYLYVLYAFGKSTTARGRGAPNPSKFGFLSQQRSVDSQKGVIALLLLYSSAVMTVSKTVLYWMNEYYSGFENIGHNSFLNLLFLWIIPNGAWLVLPSYIIYVTGSEIVQGLTIATGTAVNSSDDTALVKLE